MFVELPYDSTKPYKWDILSMIRRTWQTPLVSVTESGHSCPLIVLRQSHKCEVDHTDGLGTKGVHHWRRRNFSAAVLDALAMNLNDLVVMGAVPYKLQNHIILPTEDREAIVAIITYMVEECVHRDIAITGGETSIQQNIIGMEISQTVSGFIDAPLPVRPVPGDWILGVTSSGLHCNGLTLATQFLPDNWLDELTMPTEIYYDLIMDVLLNHDVRGLCHLAGGAYARFRELLTDKLDATIMPISVLPVFNELYKYIKDDNIMYKTFNCGYGFLFTAEAETAKSIIIDYDNVYHLGEIKTGTGQLTIKSSFTGKMFDLV